MTPKEIYLELLKKDGRPERLLKQYEAFEFCTDDPVGKWMGALRKPDGQFTDRWGVTYLAEAGTPGAMPQSEVPELKVCPDITHWRDYVHFPEIESCTEGWEECRSRHRAAAGDEKLFTAFMGGGIFEQCHYLMGFSDTLTNLYEHPDEMHELIDALTDYRIRYAKMLIDGLQPDVLFTHDDWGTKTSLFMNPEMWRAFYKEPYRRFYGYIRSRGVMTVHHADSYLAPIVTDMAEIGIQCWQGVLPDNDIPALQKVLDGSMILMGGIGAEIDNADSTEEDVRVTARKMLTEDAPGGHFIPCITYGLPGSIYKHVDPVINEEIDRYNAQAHMPASRGGQVPERVKAAAAETAAVPQETAAASGDVLSSIREAMIAGRRRQVLDLTGEALSQGIPAQQIMDEALVSAMTSVGDAFSEGRAFVPEMLMAARCMYGAMDLLKPHLGSADQSQGPALKAVLGTVRGDKHDIGKNLVKIMLEGSGIEVIDLGTDVPAEQFIETAVSEGCQVIACSALLTTSRDEMKRVVELAEKAGIRDRVKIALGGAAVSESFAMSIGADLYTTDAAQCAKALQELR